MWLPKIFIAQHYSHAIIIIAQHYTIAHVWHHAHNYCERFGDEHVLSVHVSKTHQAKKTLIEESQSILELVVSCS